MLTPIGLIYGIPTFAFQNKKGRKFIMNSQVYKAERLVS